MIIGAIQLDVIGKNKAANLDKIQRLLNQRADLVVLPELFSTGYFFDSREELIAMAEAVPGGYTTNRLCQIATEKDCHLTGAIAENDGGALYITAVMVGPQGYIGKHRKRHLTIGEAENFSRGGSSEIFDILGSKVGVLVCLEGWFPESARELMLKGAQVLCHTALTCMERTLDIMRVRAIENKAYLVVANSISTECFKGQQYKFRGESRVIDHDGNILADAGREEKLIAVEIDEKLTIDKGTEDCKSLADEARRHEKTLFATSCS